MPITAKILIPLSDGVDVTGLKHVDIFESIAEHIRNDPAMSEVADHVPSMTTYNVPTPWVITDSGWTVAAWNLFKVVADRAYDTFVNPTWIVVDCGSGNEKVVNKYTITAYSINTRTPRAWTLQGSQTGAFAGEQTTLDTRTGYTTWSALEKKTFTCANMTAYRFYKINITENNGDEFIDLGQMELGSSTSYPASVSPVAVWKNHPVGTIIKWSTARVVIEKIGVIQAATSTDWKCQKAVNNGAYNGTWLTLSALRALADDTITDATYSVKVQGQWNSDTTYETLTNMYMVVDVEYLSGGGVIIIDEGVIS